MRKFRIHLNGKTYEVAVEEIDEAGDVAGKAGKPSEIPPLHRSPVPSRGDEIIAAPMPGKIVSIRIKTGQKVEKGDLILTLEAMKMENEIFCGKDGTVKEIHVEEGANVNAGDVMVVIG